MSTRIGWTHINEDITLRHRLTVSVPMSVLGLFDNAVSLLTLAYVQPGLALGWAFSQTLRNSRRARSEEPVSR